MTDALGTLAPIDHNLHVDRVRAALAQQGLDAVLVTNTTNIRWLTGFTGSNAVVLLGADSITLVTDGRYADQAPMQLEASGVDATVAVGHDAVPIVADAAGAHRVAAEADHITWESSERYRSALDGELVPLATPIVRLRAVKDAGELDRIRTAARIADSALAEVAPRLIDGLTEREIALALEVAMRERGATSSAYETIVASGPNGALPHARPSNRVIERGDLVIIDVGALYDGYRSDMTRTFVVGAPTSDQERQLEVVREAQRRGVEAVRAGTSTKEIDGICRSWIAEAGWADEFSHGTGHGVGLDIHELPSVSSRSDDLLEAGMVVTVEPGVYLPGVSGVRWEDLLVVGEDSAEVLTHTPKDPRLGSH